jgi:hypothetical protein
LRKIDTRLEDAAVIEVIRAIGLQLGDQRPGREKSRRPRDDRAEARLQVARGARMNVNAGSDAASDGVSGAKA